MSAHSSNPCISLGQGCTTPTNFPSYIDSASCLCGLLKSASSLPNNGEQEQMWRCIGNASDNVSSGEHGKWYNTSLPSQELSGINKPQNWGENPPSLSQVYILEGHHDNAAYQKWSSGSSPSLIGNDEHCTGKNDTGLTGMYYAKGKGASSSMSSSSPSLPATSSATSAASASASSASATATTSTASSGTGTAMPTSSSSPSASPTGGASSAAPRFTLSSALLLGMVTAPLVSLFL